MNMENKAVLTIPHDFEGEQAVLGAIIEDNKLFSKVSSILTPNSFHTEAHRHIYRAMLELISSGTPIDAITIGDQLKTYGKLEEIGGYAYLAEIQESTPVAGNIEYYARVIQEHAMMRNIISGLSDISRKARDPQQGVKELLIEADTILKKISDASKTNTTVRIENSINDLRKKLEERDKSGAIISGIPTCYEELDKLISGLCAPDLITIAADSGQGKTTFALNIVENIYTLTQEMKATLIFSREMAHTQLTGRILASVGKFDSRKIRTGKLSQGDWDKITSASDRLGNKPIFFNDKIREFDEAIFEVKKLNKEIKIGLVVFDYLQLFSSKNAGNREREIAYMSGSAKDLAIQLDIPVIQLSQLNRGVKNREDNKPELSDLRESGAIEHDSDVILFVYRPGEYKPNIENLKGKAWIIAAKVRGGPKGTVPMKFTGWCNRFESLNNDNQYTRF
jgi:replicative DNA helicase